MTALWERLYYRLQSAFVFVEKRILVRKLGLLPSINYRYDLIKTLYPIRGRVAASSAFIDIGANAGEFSQIFAHIYHPELLICAEPNERLNEFIKENTKGYKVIILNKAVSNKECEMDFYVHSDLHSHMSSLFPSNADLMKRDFGLNDPDSIIKKKVQVTTLDLIVEQYNRELSNKTIFLKVDTQGNELEVLAGGSKALSFVHYCLLEYMFQSPYEKQYPFEEIILLMSSKGFACLGPVHTAYRSTGEVGAVLFLFGKK